MHIARRTRRLGALPLPRGAALDLESSLFREQRPNIQTTLTRTAQTHAARSPECLSICDSLSTEAPAPGEISAKERCFNLCLNGAVADPVTAGRNQARCAGIIHGPDAALFSGDQETAWSMCVTDPDGFVTGLQASGLPLQNPLGAQPWYKKPSTWLIAGAALAAGAVVYFS